MTEASSCQTRSASQASRPPREPKARRSLPILGALLGLFASLSARADLGPPYITPETPTQADTIVLHALQDACNVLNTGLIPPQITQSEGTIDVLVTGDHETDPEFCSYGSGVANVPIGMYSPGNYLMRVTWQYPGIGGSFEQRHLGDIEFVVVRDQPSGAIAEAPAINGIGAIALAILLSAVVWRQRVYRVTK